MKWIEKCDNNRRYFLFFVFFPAMTNNIARKIITTKDLVCIHKYQQLSSSSSYLYIYVYKELKCTRKIMQTSLPGAAGSKSNQIIIKFFLLLLLDGRKGYSSLRLPLSFVYKNVFFVCWVDELPITQEKYLSLYRFLIRRWRDVCVLCFIRKDKKFKIKQNTVLLLLLLLLLLVCLF